MWQKWNRQPQISAPSQFVELDRDDPYEDRYLETIHEVDSICSRRQSTHLPGLPELPFRAVPPMAEIPQPVNIYSQQPCAIPAATPKDLGLKLNVHMQQQAYDHDISPITPREPQDRVADDKPISPIENAVPIQARAPLPERHLQSQIPRKVSQSAEERAQTKWDEYSGEPTNNEHGKPASVRPGAQPVEIQYPHLKERTKQILAGIREREAAKKAPWGKIPPPVAAAPPHNPPQREPWRGASARNAIVDPVRDTPTARKQALQAQRPLPNEGGQSPFYAAVTASHGTESSAAVPHLQTAPSQESIKPVVPLKTRNLTPDLTRLSPVQSPSKQRSPSPTPSPEPVLNADCFPPDSSHPRVESPQDELEPTTPTTPVPAHDTHTDRFVSTPPSFVSANLGREQSHFSWTTYTDSVEDSPRSLAQIVRESSPPLSIPELPPAITIKKRPISSSPFVQSHPYMRQYYADSTGSVVRKPLPVVGAPPSPAMSATSRAFSTSKSLPPTPTVTEATDKIESFEAQLQGLERRKRNTMRIIADLEASLKKNAVVYDMSKRREVEKNIANHKMSLDDITAEVHELSLRLHRAQRKRDRDDNYEINTGLWIKRVTS
ncbi:hypothetical protein LTS08_006768 [Lithohypha guttulata]|nr:hypothetical protein LTS08_006768 [Lithohypha guttulata]